MKMANCDNKNLYTSKLFADDYTHFYNKDFFGKESDKLDSYYCSRHRGWHVGHRKSWEQLSKTERINKLLDEPLDFP